MEKKIKIGLIVLVVILISGCIQQKPGPKEVPKIYETLFVSLDEEFVLHKNQSAKIIGEDLEVKIVEFHNSPCPRGIQCVWSGVGITFEYSSNGELERGTTLVQAFGFQTTILETDYETFARLRVNRIK